MARHDGRFSIPPRSLRIVKGAKEENQSSGSRKGMQYEGDDALKQPPPASFYDDAAGIEKEFGFPDYAQFMISN